jgi:hypothetical protein
MKRLRYKPYVDQKARWPGEGRAILAQYDDDSVVVYQAYSERIGHAAARQGRLDVPGFSLERMSWIKSSFLWMMHRCEWATAPGQTVVLAVWLRREAFDGILARAVLSHYDGRLYPDRAAWQAALDESEVRVQWDPDYPPRGPKLARRAIQIGLSGETLRRYAAEWLVHVEDITEFVRQQAEYAEDDDLLLVPAQRVYPIADEAVARRIGLGE